MGYAIFKLIHLLAVVIFLGNIITGLFWMWFAVKTKDLKIIHFTMKGILLADRYFTLPGVIFIVAGGIFAAVLGHYPLLHTKWIFWSIVMISISGLAFAFKVAPVQRKIYQVTSNKETSADFDWKNFDKLYLAWDFWGLIAILTPLAALAMMTFKFPK